MIMLSFQNNHVFICGVTRSGKTYFSAKALSSAPAPVIFFNLQDEELPKNFFKIHSSKMQSSTEVIDYLKNGLKVDLRLPLEPIRANAIIGNLVAKLMGAGFTERNPVYVVFDEAHLLSHYGKQKAIEAATRGLKRGIRCIFITQRPANCNKTLYTQSIEHYLFKMGRAEKEYLKNKGIDYKTMEDMWVKNGKYSYVEFDGINLIGHKPIK